MIPSFIQIITTGQAGVFEKSFYKLLKKSKLDYATLRLNKYMPYIIVLFYEGYCKLFIHTIAELR